jgi:hypothetical protein
MYISEERARNETAANNGMPADARPDDPAAAREPGVELAYRIIDKHINDGRQRAAMLNAEPYNIQAATDRLQEVIERTIRYSAELLPLWLEALTTAVRIEPPQTPAAAPTVSNGGNQDRGEGSTAVAIEMISTRPVTVSIDLRENSERMPLAVLGLRALERDKPELSDIHIAPDPAGGLRLRICIPEGHPPGSYYGVILNRESGESRGTLTVRVSDP